MSSPPPARPSTATLLGAALAPEVAAFVLGNIATFPNLPWYATLRKPGFTPPDWLFGPAWTVLYLLMAAALFRVLRLPRATPGRQGAIAAFLVQIALNAAWSWAFFAAHDPALGLAVMLALVAGVTTTLVLVARLDRSAGLALAPYLAWLGYAAALNGAILRLNG